MARVCTAGLMHLLYLTISMHQGYTQPELEDILGESGNYSRAACALG